MHNKYYLGAISFILLSLSAFSSSQVYAADKLVKPKLVLQITVDQLRGDLLFRYQDRYTKKGFNYLINQGTVYRDAHHTHANTETIVGHVTLATGAPPSGHGLIGNIWYDRDLGHSVYNIEDENYQLLTAGADVDKNTELDPTQKAASTEGRSPKTIAASTFSDELIIATDGQAKVFGVSIKDRGAVSMAGHGGKAIWFSKQSQEFVSSNYYFDKYPQWINDWNAKKIPATYADTAWELMNERSTYTFGEKDDNPWEADFAGYSRVFPHPFGGLDSKYFSTLLTLSPVGDELTSSFAKELIINEKIGQDNVTDYLSLSFSSTDYIGHFFGLSSLETEDNMLRLDRTLSDLFSFIDKNIGLKNTLIVLSADHGAPEIPSYLVEKKLQGKYVTPQDWDDLDQVMAVKKQLGIKEQLVESYHHPYIYLNQKTIQKNKLNLTTVQNLVADSLVSIDDIYHAVSSNKIESNQLPNTKINRAVVNNYFPGRSGDIYIIFKPQEFISDMDGLKVPSVHGSLWTYDTFVPVIFAGKNITPKHIYKRVQTVDVAPTMSAIIGIKAPSASEGKIMTDVFDD